MKFARSDGYSFAQVLFGTKTVYFWAEGGNKEEKIVRKLNWPATVINGIRRGWALQGFDKWRKLNELRPWMDRPLRNFLLTDLVRVVELRRKGDKDYVPRTRVETVHDSRIT